MGGSSEVIEESLEKLAERAGDPTQAVYARLFARYPEMQALFVRDVNGAVRGEMLAKSLECALDLAGPNAYAANFIRCEVVNHEGVGVPADVFPRFYEVAVETFAELLGDDWIPAYEAAWGGIVARVAELA
ncbi:globin [Phenylobacterium sp.]|uniref:globin n=1 Tax=Phenylobacterium sp. TaxID=1871053 RepID=UPI0026066088|nr:globin [Phenylobacterium sp.]